MQLSALFFFENFVVEELRSDFFAEVKLTFLFVNQLLPIFGPLDIYISLINYNWFSSAL
jgi:hypothetical protein